VTNSDLAWWQPGFDAIPFGLSLILIVDGCQSPKGPRVGNLHPNLHPNLQFSFVLLLCYYHAPLARYFVTDRQFGPPPRTATPGADRRCCSSPSRRNSDQRGDLSLSYL
jgi:hypothetical protein